METPLDLLIRQAKEQNSIESYIGLFQAYKSGQKYFSAQQTLERCLSSVKLPQGSCREDNFSVKIKEIISSHEDYKAPPSLWNQDFFLVYSFLGDITLILKKPVEAVGYLLAAYQNYGKTSELEEKILANVVFAGLLESFMSIMTRFLYEKQYKLTFDWKNHIDWLIGVIKGSEEYRLTTEKLELMIGNYYFMLFSWYGKTEDFEVCERHLQGIGNLEVQFILAYYRDRGKAKKLIKELVMENPGISLFWAWLSLTENDYKRKINAVSKAISLDKSNWNAWVSLGIIQAGHGDVISASKTWKTAHYFNHFEPRLWLLSSFFYKEAKQYDKALQSFKLACDLEPSMWITIENYLST